MKMPYRAQIVSSERPFACGRMRSKGADKGAKSGRFCEKIGKISDLTLDECNLCVYNIGGKM